MNIFYSEKSLKEEEKDRSVQPRKITQPKPVVPETKPSWPQKICPVMSRHLLAVFCFKGNCQTLASCWLREINSLEALGFDKKANEIRIELKEILNDKEGK